MEEKKVQRSLIVEMDEAKTEIIQVINNAIQVRGLPLYILAMMLDGVCAQVKEGAKNELAMAKAQMENDEGVA